MIAAWRSELTRSRRVGVLAGWFGLTALFAAMTYLVVFQFVGDAGTAPAAGPGVVFPTVAQLESAEGIMAGLASASSILGVVTLSYWAVLTAADHTTGLVRLLVAAQPRRWKLVAGKVAALLAWTATATSVAVVVAVGVAPAMGQGSGLDLSSWGTDLTAVLVGAWVDLFLALVVWGSIGLVLATLTRSAAVAISAGAAWVLIVESLVSTAASGLADWLPGATISALASGGTDAIAFPTALLLGTAYVGVALGCTMIVFTRRDITD